MPYWNQALCHGCFGSHPRRDGCVKPPCQTFGRASNFSAAKSAVRLDPDRATWLRWPRFMTPMPGPRNTLIPSPLAVYMTESSSLLFGASGTAAVRGGRGVGGGRGGKIMMGFRPRGGLKRKPARRPAGPPAGAGSTGGTATAEGSDGAMRRRIATAADRAALRQQQHEEGSEPAEEEDEEEEEGGEDEMEGVEQQIEQEEEEQAAGAESSDGAQLGGGEAPASQPGQGAPAGEAGSPAGAAASPGASGAASGDSKLSEKEYQAELERLKQRRQAGGGEEAAATKADDGSKPAAAAEVPAPAPAPAPAGDKPAQPAAAAAAGPAAPGPAGATASGPVRMPALHWARQRILAFRSAVMARGTRGSILPMHTQEEPFEQQVRGRGTASARDAGAQCRYFSVRGTHAFLPPHPNMSL